VTGSPAALPNWFGPDERPRFFDEEVSAAGPAGTVVAYEIGTFHRGTQLTAPRGARYTLHVNFRPAAADWAVRHGWADRSHQPVASLRAAGVGPAARAVRDPAARPSLLDGADVAGMAERYPGLDVSPWSPPSA
jgi:hypothetical protein